MLKIVIIALAILIFLIGVVLAIGFFLPKPHVVSRAIVLHQKPEVVFALITDFKAAPAWRSNVKQVELLPPAEGKILFRETSSDGVLTMEVHCSKAPSRLVTRIVDKDLPFGGYWIYEIIPTVEGARLNITERGEIYNPVFRFVARYFLGYTRTIDTYLRNVASKYGETSPVTNGIPEDR